MDFESKPIISVIIPVYNVERFLKECLDSVLNQQVKDIEIILVDDGSTDSSGEICNEYARRDKRIKVIHQNNSGVSSARNAGLKIAVGEYIAFADSDDLLPSDAYSKLISEICDESLVVGRIQLITEDRIFLQTNKIHRNRISTNEFLDDLFSEKEYPYLGYLFDKLFFSRIIRTYNLWFDERVKVNEDRMFVLKYAMRCKDVIMINDLVYYYRQRKTSVMSQTRCTQSVSDIEMTIILSFEEMKKRCLEYSKDLYYTCSKKAFECALDLRRRILPTMKEEKRIIQNFLLRNCCVCLTNPHISIVNKVKILGHTILKR